MDPRTRSDDGVDARMELAAWLRAGRDRRNLTIEDVAKVTKIQPRILEKLESGQLDGLPAAVFVKGFVRSFAKCVGLDESEALDRYSAAQAQAGQPQLAVAKALVETMARKANADESRGKRGSRAATASGEEPRVPRAESSREIAIATMLEGASAEPAGQRAVLARASSPELASEQAASERASSAELATSGAPSAELAPSAEPASQSAPSAEPTLASTASANAPEAEAAPAPRAAVVASPTAHATSEGSKKKRSRKKNQNAQQRARKKKRAQQAQLAAVEPRGAAIAERAIDTAPVAKIDGESREATSIEAKTSDAIGAPAHDEVVESGTVAEPSLAEGSQRMKAAVVDAIGDAAPAGMASTVTASDACDAGTADGSASAAVASAADATAHADANGAGASTSADDVTGKSAGDSAAEPTAGTWQPTMPPLTSTSVPWRRPRLPVSTAYVVPTLVIDDADPESADREREQRAAKEPHRLSFLPPILLDREDRSARQGGLTLAVIILLIAATLTLSYLMRRPSPSGDGVTMLDARSLVA